MEFKITLPFAEVLKPEEVFDSQLKDLEDRLDEMEDYFMILWCMCRAAGDNINFAPRPILHKVRMVDKYGEWLDKWQWELSYIYHDKGCRVRGILPLGTGLMPYWNNAARQIVSSNPEYKSFLKTRSLK